MKYLLKSILILAIIIPFSACKQQQADKAFKSVDCTIRYGYLKSIKVLGDGQTYIRYDRKSTFDNNLIERSEFYSIILEKNQLDSISEMAAILLNNGIDSLSESAGNNRLAIRILIRSDEDKLPLTQNTQTVKDYKPLYKLVNYLDELSQKVITTSDTTFVFESRKF